VTHEKFLEAIKLALGSPVTFDARPHLAKLIQTRGTRISLRYEWIKNPNFYSWSYNNPEVEIGDGQEWITIWIVGDSSQTPPVA
jgi:hypothetical protein